MRAVFIGRSGPRFSTIWTISGDDIIPAIPLSESFFNEGWLVSGSDIVAEGSPALSPWLDSAPDMIAEIYTSVPTVP